jgi:hypothetical protein
MQSQRVQVQGSVDKSGCEDEHGERQRRNRQRHNQRSENRFVRAYLGASRRDRRRGESLLEPVR